MDQMWRGVLLAAALPVVGGGAMAAETGPRIDAVEYRGWPGAYRMANGEAELVVVPAVARIMHYSPAGGENVLWEDPSLAGKTGEAGEWFNFGGDKAWIWPQSGWKSKWGNWPPPHECDQAPHLAAESGSLTVSLSSPVIEGYGVRIVRAIRLAERGTRVEIRTMVTRGANDAAGAWAAWSVTQIKKPDYVLARLVPGHRVEKRMLSETKWEAIRRQGLDLLRLDLPADTSAKVGLDADVLAAVRGGVLFTQRVRAAGPVLGGMEPGELAQVFTSPGGGETKAEPYVELEFTSRPLPAAGEGEAVLDVVWELERLPAKSRGAAAEAVRRR